MKVIGVIPARWASTRFPGKVLAKIQGKPMIQHVWQRATETRLLDDVMIACDHDEVFKVAESFGAHAVMTSQDHDSGTDRIVEAVKDLNVEMVVNIQGDEPLIQPEVIDALTQGMIQNPKYSMATVIRRVASEYDLLNPNVIKVVIDCHGDALYFSRHAIPFNREKKDFIENRYYKHIGLYAYEKKFLMNYKMLPSSMLEQTEKLEQLRALEAGYRIKTIETAYENLSVDTEEDLKRVEEMLIQEKVHGKNDFIK